MPLNPLWASIFWGSWLINRQPFLPRTWVWAPLCYRYCNTIQKKQIFAIIRFYMKWIHLTERRNSKHINSWCFEPALMGMHNSCNSRKRWPSVSGFNWANWQLIVRILSGIYYLLVLIIRRWLLTMYENHSVKHISFLVVGQKWRHFPQHFLEIFCLLSCIQEPVIGPYCKLNESSILPHTYHCEIYFNIIFSSRTWKHLTAKVGTSKRGRK